MNKKDWIPTNINVLFTYRPSYKLDRKHSHCSEQEHYGWSKCCTTNACVDIVDNM